MFLGERVACFVQDPSFALRAGGFTIHEGLDDLFPAQGAGFAFTHDEGNFVGLIGCPEYRHILRCMPLALRLATAMQE
ncbi:hypothetical protein RC55_23980 [Herbaspirillum seropedicae]|nr:hypothetical protein ACP92_07335 [Herbaspirillum seropedicae]NQE32254.1 hypothetical protein [Herbaspirillum seropedicae]